MSSELFSIGSVDSICSRRHVYARNCTAGRIELLSCRTIEGAGIATELQRAELHVEESNAAVHSVTWHFYSAGWDFRWRWHSWALFRLSLRLAYSKGIQS